MSLFLATVLFPLWVLMSPMIAPITTVYLMSGCNVVTTAVVTKTTPVDMITCNLTVDLPSYNVIDRNIYVPCSMISRMSSLKTLTVVTNHKYQTCLKPVLSLEDTYMIPYQTVEFVHKLGVSGLAMLFVMFAIVFVNQPR